MLPEKNGRASAGKRLGHINVRHFFVADRIAKNELTVEHYPTKEMTGGHFTKPILGGCFYKTQNRIMDIQHVDNKHIHGSPKKVGWTLLSTVSEPQECVGDSSAHGWMLVGRKVRQQRTTTSRM